MSELRDAPPEFSDRLQRLIAAYHPHLAKARIKVEVRDRAPRRAETISFAEVDTPDNDGEERQFDFAMWFSLEAWAGLDELQRDALADHELCHCVWDELGKPLLALHDIEEFYGVMLRYGLWWPGASEMLDVLAQMPEGVKEMPYGYGGYQRPMQGFTSRGGYQQPAPGFTSRGGYQQPGPGFTSRGGFQTAGGNASVVWSDPDLQEGGDFYVLPIGGGRVIEVSPQAYEELKASILADLQGAIGAGNQEPQPGFTSRGG